MTGFETALLISQLAGPIMGMLGAGDDPNTRQSFEGKGSISPEAMMRQNATLVNRMMQALTDRAASPVGTPSAFAQQPGAYCLRQYERILTSSLEWVPCGDLVEGAGIMAFDETAKMGGRSWQPAIVTMSKPTKAHCVRVYLENDECITTTAEHPWLVESGGSARKLWVRSDQLMQPNKARRLAWKVLKVASPWKTENSFDAGWLSGIWDGEGFVSHGRDTWKAGVSQLPGLVSDRFRDHMKELGFALHVGLRSHGRGNPINHFGFRGDFEELMALLGRLRPVRLLQNFLVKAHLRKLVVKNRLRVVAIESAGYRDIQSITTSARTYVGEGYLMHNSGGGLPMPIGLVAQDPALANPSLLNRPGMGEFQNIMRGLTTDFGLDPGGFPSGPGGNDPAGAGARPGDVDISDPIDSDGFDNFFQTQFDQRSPQNPRGTTDGGDPTDRNQAERRGTHRRGDPEYAQLVRADDLFPQESPGDDLSQAMGSVQLLLDAFGQKASL